MSAKEEEEMEEEEQPPQQQHGGNVWRKSKVGKTRKRRWSRPGGRGGDSSSSRRSRGRCPELAAASCPAAAVASGSDWRPPT